MTSVVASAPIPDENARKQRIGGEPAVSVITPVVSAISRAVRAIAGLLPDGPSDDAPPPDVDGKRKGELDPDDLRRMDAQRKDGHGGYR
ncbi:MAG TPA: hypothetical protein VGM28_07340 [Candidatus Limnocylindrales bacterium]